MIKGLYTVLKDGAKEPVNAFNWDTDIDKLPIKIKWECPPRKKYGKRKRYISEPIFLDTETSHFGEHEGWIHQWAFQWYDFFVIGRNALQLADFFRRANDWVISKSENSYIKTYIHNLSYDMEYMRGFFDREPEPFAVKPHRILKSRYGNIEFCCSYLLTQKSLSKWAKDSNARHPKLEGEYDYERVITPNTPLSLKDWAYQLNDCAAMSDSWHNDRKSDGYTVATVPMTSTGFVRADCRAAAFSDPFWKKRLDAMQPDIVVYNALEECFSGGYTHGNRFYKETTIRGCIGHRDFRSSYPTRQMLNSFPMGKFTPCDIQSIGDVKAMMKNSALLMHIALKNPQLRDRSITAPYLSYSKCKRVGKTSELLDNGRIIKLEGVVHLWGTELDFIMIHRQYKADGLQFLDSYSAPKGKLPKWFRDCIMKYFSNKTTMKDIDYQLYMLSKAMLNSLYGMTAQKNIRDEIVYLMGEWKVEKFEAEKRADELLKHIKKDTTFLPFAWGVWTTAYARYALFECIEKIGYNKFLYADTDSIFYLLDEKTEQSMQEYNDKIISKAIAAGATVTHNGKLVALGEFTAEDDHKAQAFRFVHAKCYALIDPDGVLKATIAGVTKKSRDKKRTNADELETIDNLQTGFIFKDCGGSRIVYNNSPRHIINVNGEDVECTSSAVIMPTEYKVHDNWNMDEDEELLYGILNPEMLNDIYGSMVGIK